MTPLYLALVRMHLQYHVLSWDPQKEMDIDLTEWPRKGSQNRNATHNKKVKFTW